MPLEDLVDPAGIHAVRRCDVVLVLSVPVPEPDIHCVVQRESVGWFILVHFV